MREAAAEAGVLQEVFVTADAKDRYGEVVSAALSGGAAVHVVSGEVIDSLSQTVTPQGVLGVCRFVGVDLTEVLRQVPRLVAVLAHVRDPGNAGTVIRAADAAGADAVIVTDASVDVYNGKCVRASAGSLFHLPIVAGIPVAEAVSRLRSAGLRMLAADGHGDRDLDDALDSGELAAPTGWLFGNEAWGLPESMRALADGVVRVPIHGRAESLNLATAAAVCLYASARAHRRRFGSASNGSVLSG